MTEASVAESARLVQPCADCGRFESTLRAPADLLRPERHICEACAEPGKLWRQCEPAGPQPGRRPFVALDVEFLGRVRPMLTAVEFVTYLVAIQLCDGSRGLCSQARIAAEGRLSRRNVVSAVELLERIGLLVRAASYGARGSRYLVVRACAVGSDPGRPCLVRPGVFEEAEQALSVIRGSRVTSTRDPGITATRDPAITATRDPAITDRLSICTKDFPQTNHLAGGSPAHPPQSGGHAANATCVLAEAAAEAAAASWPDYSRRVLTERAAQLMRWADAADEPASAPQVATFLTDGAEQAWIRRGVDSGRISSGLHVWCDRDRWLYRLRESNRRASRRAERVRLAEVRELPQAERVRLARQALDRVDAASRSKRVG